VGLICVEMLTAEVALRLDGDLKSHTMADEFKDAIVSVVNKPENGAKIEYGWNQIHIVCTDKGKNREIKFLCVYGEEECGIDVFQKTDDAGSVVKIIDRKTFKGDQINALVAYLKLSLSTDLGVLEEHSLYCLVSKFLKENNKLNVSSISLNYTGRVKFIIALENSQIRVLNCLFEPDKCKIDLRFKRVEGVNTLDDDQNIHRNEIRNFESGDQDELNEFLGMCVDFSNRL
jgi:hypothetical protein